MYTVGSIGKDRDGIEFLRNIIKFPIELGFTGKSMKLQKPLVYYKPEGGDYNETESSIPNKEFLSEVDNYVTNFPLSLSV